MNKSDPIKHVVVLMLENASFDRMLGCKMNQYPRLEGINPNSLKWNSDFVDKSKRFSQRPGANRLMKLDPEHDVPDVLRQIAGNCGGFVPDFAQRFPQATDEDKQEVMAYFDNGSLPMLHRLATKFTICDHWFSSLPGPTWPNRFFIHSGTSLGHVDMPDGSYNPHLHWYDQPTVYQRLSEKNITWGIYYGDFPQSTLLVQQWRYPFHYHQMARFFEHVSGPAEKFPQYSFIEPAYFGAAQNDQHPPSDVFHGEKLLAQVYNALAANSDLWESTLLVVVYDEHGGFYDHVPPPAAVPPDAHTKNFAFDRYGVRVPALLVSPWAREGVDSTVFDHTSILRYVSDKWSLGPLGNRVANANSIAVALGGEQRDLGTEIPTYLPEDAIPNEPQERLNANQESLTAFSRFLEVELQQNGEDLNEIAKRALRAANSPEEAGKVSVERFEKFLSIKRERPQPPTIVRAQFVD